MSKRLKKVWLLYYEGFRDMTVGKKLWGIILIKLFIMFAILKVFFFPNILEKKFDSESDRSSYVMERLIEAPSNSPDAYREEFVK